MKRRFVKDLKLFSPKAARVQGLKKLVSLNVLTPWPIKIISHEGFEEFKRLGKIGEEFKTEVVEAFLEIRKKNPKRGVYAGRAYFVPGIENPPGPRSSSVKSKKQIVKEVKKLYQFVIDNKFNQRKDAEIGVIFYPFMNAGDPIPNKNEPDLQFSGGCVTPAYGDRVLIEALYGADEGVQSYSYDSYTVDYKNLKVLKKKIVVKDKSLRATSELKYETVKVPKKYQKEPALTDKELMKIAKMYKSLEAKYGQMRVEFVVQPEGVVYRECVPFKASRQAGVSLVGKVTVIENDEDLDRLSKKTKLVYVSPKVIAGRDMDLLTDLAFEAPKKLVVLFPGSASTAHAGTLLRERGHQIIYVNQRQFKPQEKVVIKDGKVEQND